MPLIKVITENEWRYARLCPAAVDICFQQSNCCSPVIVEWMHTQSNSLYIK